MRKQAGFSLVEVLFSLVIMTLILAGVAPGFLHQMSTITDNEDRTGALTAAQMVLDEIRVGDPYDLPSSGSDSPVSVSIGNKTFDVTVSYCTIAAYCTSANTRQMFVEVRRNGELIYDVDTVYTKLK